MRRVYLEHTVVDVTPEQRATLEVVKLIRKLRWIGMEEEAEQLQTALSNFPSDKRASVLAGPQTERGLNSTDAADAPNSNEQHRCY
jgi:hypothetical protein